MSKYRCVVCGYIFDEAEGDYDQHVAPGTLWSDVSEDWVCPVCGVNKYQFEPVE